MSYDEEEQLTKKQRREEARAQRKALEAAEHAGVARRKHLTLIGGSLAVLVYSRYHALPVYGFPGGFQESWAVRGAKPAAWFESAVIVLSLMGAATCLHRPRRVERGRGHDR